MQRTNEVVRIKIPPIGINIEYLSPSNSTILSDLVWDSTFTYEGYVNDCDFYFQVDSINPLSTRSYVLSHNSSMNVNKFRSSSSESKDFELSVTKVGQSKLNISFTRNHADKHDRLGFTVNYKYYKSYEKDGQKSGLYILRDEDQGSEARDYGTTKNSTVFNGNCVNVLINHGTEVDSRIVIPLHSEVLYAQVTSRIKGINGPHGKEIVIEIDGLNIRSDRFYTDSNGMVMEERILNHRDSYPLTNLTGFERVANFYPVNTAITLRDNSTQDLSKKEQLTIINDRAQAGASFKPSSIELLIARRTMFDDNRGVDEPLNETISDGRPRIYEVNHYVIQSSVSKLKKDDYMETKRLQRSLVEEPLQALFSLKTQSESIEHGNILKI